MRQSYSFHNWQALTHALELDFGPHLLMEYPKKSFLDLTFVCALYLQGYNKYDKKKHRHI